MPRTHHATIRLRTGVSLLAAGSIIAAGFAVRPATSVRAAGGTLLIARDITDGKTMDPGHFYEFTSNAMATNCYDTLVTFKGTDTAHPQPDLATSYTISPDAKVFTFHLRHGVRFSTGNPMTAADVVFSYRRLEYLNDNPAFLIAGATDIRALDTYTVRITLGAPDVSFLAALADNNFGVLDSKVVKAHGGDDSPQAAKRDKATSFLDAQSVGTGAFQLTNWTRNVQIVLTRNPYYWGQRAPMDKIVFQNQSDSATQRLLVQRGQVDVAENIDLQGAQSLRNTPSVQVVTGNTLDLIYVAMTTSAKVSKPLSDKRVRQAVRYAIDYNGILNGLLHGIGTRPNSMIPVGMLGNSASTNDGLLVQQNLTKARALLKAAGYPNGFSLKLSYDTKPPTFDGVLFEPLVNKVQNDLARIGIKVTLDPQVDTVLLPAYRAQKLQMLLYNWGVDFPDPNDYAGPFSPGGGPAKRMYYTNDKNLTNIVTQADSISDSGRRAALYRTVQQTWLDESPWIGLVQPQNIIVLGKNVKGYVYSPILPANFRTVST
jgi:peptide/nickel transport system substrate-binding protein